MKPGFLEARFLLQSDMESDIILEAKLSEEYYG